MKKIPTKKILMRKIIVKEKEVARHITEKFIYRNFF